MMMCNIDFIHSLLKGSLFAIWVVLWSLDLGLGGVGIMEFPIVN